jgi:hypothetical protein
MSKSWISSWLRLPGDRVATLGFALLSPTYLNFSSPGPACLEIDAHPAKTV